MHCRHLTTDILLLSAQFAHACMSHQASRKVVFLGSFTADGFTCAVSDDSRLQIEAEGKIQKLLPEVEQVTFCAAQSPPWQRVVYITERCVMELLKGDSSADRPAGQSRLLLTEIAPGVDLKRDVLSKMGFRPQMPPGGPRLMDPRLFTSAADPAASR